MKQAIAYLRCSTAGQLDSGVSLETQEAKVKAWCLLNDYELVSIFTDGGISGKSMKNRPELLKALAACESVGPGTAFITYSMSRMSRSTSDTITIAEKLRKAGADMISLSEKIDTSSASGRMIFRLLANLAEFEREQTVERTVAALQFKKSQGQLIGKCPYGWCLGADGKTLEVEPREQEALQLIRKLRADGVSLRKISRHLFDNGYPSLSQRSKHE